MSLEKARELLDQAELVASRHPIEADRHTRRALGLLLDLFEGLQRDELVVAGVRRTEARERIRELAFEVRGVHGEQEEFLGSTQRLMLAIADHLAPPLQQSSSKTFKVTVTEAPGNIVPTVENLLDQLTRQGSTGFGFLPDKIQVEEL